jgi:hypothetical protein
MKITYTILFILITATCVVGQRKTVSSKAKKQGVVITATKKKPVQIKVDPCSIIKTHTDRMTDRTQQFSKMPTFLSPDGRQGLEVTWNKEGNRIGLAVIASEGGRNSCMHKWANVIILLADGSKISGGIGPYNCDGQAYISVGSNIDMENNPETRNLEKMKSSKIAAMRVYTVTGYIEVDFKPWQSEKMLNELNCLFP